MHQEQEAVEKHGNFKGPDGALRQMSTRQLATDATSRVWFVNSGGELGSGLRCPVWQEAAYRLGSHRGPTPFNH